MFYKKHGKRMMDFFLSLIALIVLAPVLIIVALLIIIKLGTPMFMGYLAEYHTEEVQTNRDAWRLRRIIEIRGV